MSKNVLFVIDELEFKYFEFNDLVTNFWFIKELLIRGFCVDIATKNKLFVENNCGKVLSRSASVKNQDIFYEKEDQRKPINDYDVVFFRPDPPVDIDYINACYVFDFVDLDKTFVINNPVSVRNFNEKFHINYFPDFVPKNIVTSSKSLIREFVENNKEAIIKPLNRCFGSGVYYLNREDKNLNSIVNTVTENEKTSVMVQEYLPEAVNGDKRVLIIGGKVYDECIRKLPGDNDFKFNTHSDKFFAADKLTEKEKQMAQDIASSLEQKGLYLVGLDVISEKVIEINVTSPCYFIREINNKYGINFQDKIMADLVELIDLKTSKKACQICSN